MLLHKIWIFYIVICISSWLPSTNPSISLSSPSSVSSNSFSKSSLDESSFFLPASSFTFSSSLPIHPINSDDDDPKNKQLNGESHRTRFTRSYRNFGLHRVDFNVPSNLVLGENTTAPESGPWSPWSEPSRCSRPCGGGVRSQKRFCTDTDVMGRSTCTGPDTRYYSCNIQPCPEPVDFRTQQCSMFNNQSIPLTIGRVDKVEWEPYTRSTDRPDEDLCALNCKPKNGTWYTKLMERVIDGTKCLRETDWVSGICVAGNCLPVGCDGLLGSPAEEDKCRVCGGEGKECNTVRDTFAENLPAGYQDIVLIPRGATYIRIQELAPSRNFLAVRDSSGRYYLNGHWTFETTLTDFEAGGTRFEYGKRPVSSPTGAIAESLYALGPLRSPLYIQMVYQDNTPGIEYEYSVPSNIPVPSIWAPPDAYQYMLGSYGPCSRPCGKGVQIRPARCVRLKTGEFVPLEFCSKEIMPQLSRSCNEIDCPPAYHKSNWSSCICPGIKTRSVFCEEVRATGERLVLDDSKCGNEPKPNSISSCPPDDCYELINIVGNQTETPIEFKWNTTEWSKCSSRCGQGKRSREVTCVNLNGTRVHDSQCPSNERPESEGVCASVPCEGGVDWVTSEWSNCSVPCGPMMSTRSVICAGTDGLIYDETVCGLERKPSERRNCTENPGCDYSWFTTDWSSCSASCGRGLQTRHVLCGLFDDDTIKVDESKCAGKSKPISVRTCRAPVECSATLYYGPWGPCQCGKEERTLLCLSATNTTGGKLPLEKCNVTTTKIVDSDNNITLTDNATLTGNETLTDNATVIGNETFAGNETLTGNETLIENKTLIENETLTTNEKSSSVSLILIPTNRTCEWNRPSKEEADVSDVAPEPSGNNSLPVDCCNSQFGCCPDKVTPRKLDFSNCFKEQNTEVTSTTTVVDQVTTVPTTEGSVDNVTSSLNNTESIRVEKVTPPACLTSTYGCCWDGIKPAFGPFKLGCKINCNNTLFGCCPDNKTPKTNETELNCPPKCLSSPFGCCDDNITEAGVNRTNCPIKPIPGPGDTDENIEGSGSNEICLEIEGSGDGDSDGNVTSSCSKPAKAKATTSVTCSESVDGSNGTVCSLVAKEPTPPCNTTTFGCCPDGLTARKTEDDDCTCSRSEFGCCPDNSTLATGLNQEGCPCNTFPYKCCQDEYTRATGPDYEGCICSRMLFGCCSDGLTPARGPNQLGCGCNSTLFGCCPDNTTAAGGPNYSGCPCRTLPHGCCPDQKTPAKGPNSEGCPCESFTHGCCFDGVTPATGPNYKGCDCTKAPWHCCQDYTTVALGPNFEGCPGGPALEISRAPDACVLPRERGPCRNFTIKWYYDSSYGGCVRFWYGGCNGNANRFQSEEECDKICINPDGHLRCNLPAIFGACGLNITKYYFNPETRSCETFQYSGCLGNKNNFNTRTECEAFCLHPETLDRCDQPVDRGHCTRKQLRYHYDRSTDSCQAFDWGGCGGNQNNFNTIEDCQRRCSVVKKEIPETLCYLPRSEGKCLGRYPRWFFDAVTQECREFIYTGCDGNHNRFVSKNDCEKMCNSTRRAVPQPSILAPFPSVISPSIDVCKLPVSTGSPECNERLVAWYYNDIYGVCVPFDYRGCGGNGNRFNIKEECEARCSRSHGPYYPQSYPVTPSQSSGFRSPIGPPAPEPGVDQCTLAQSRGVSCLGRNRTVELRWSFDPESRSCARFYYSGCGGTANNFRSENECLSTCAHHINYGSATSSSPVSSSTPFVTPSSLPSSSPVWPETSLDRSTPRPFSWPLPSSPVVQSYSSGGRYQTETNDVFSMQSCILPKDPGGGQDSMNLWYYDPMDGVCKTFYYTGFGGNANRFNSRKECENKCWSSQDICRLPPVRGRCGGSYPVYYYDSSSRDCLPFTYGGCEGNANRFDSLEECRLRCRN